MKLEHNDKSVDVRQTSQHYPNTINCKLVFTEEGRDGKRYLETSASMIWIKKENLDSDDEPRSKGDITRDELEEIFEYLVDSVESQDAEIDEVKDLRITQEEVVRKVKRDE